MLIHELRRRKIGFVTFALSGSLDPDSFKPERFLRTEDGEPAIKHPYSFLPFGGGPRNCLGMRLALVEAKMCIVQILKR